MTINININDLLKKEYNNQKYNKIYNKLSLLSGLLVVDDNINNMNKTLTNLHDNMDNIISYKTKIDTITNFNNNIIKDKIFSKFFSTVREKSHNKTQKIKRKNSHSQSKKK